MFETSSLLLVTNRSCELTQIPFLLQEDTQVFAGSIFPQRYHLRIAAKQARAPI